MKHIKKFDKFSTINDSIIIVKSDIEFENDTPKDIINEDIKVDISENIINVIPGKDKIYLNHKFDR